MHQHGTLFVIAAPSGAGKTSLVSALLDVVEGVKVSVSHTTRAPRPGETEGENYHFVDDAAFQQLVDAQAFLEYADVFGARYGTSREWVVAQLKQGKDIILEIDWQGARQVRQQFPEAVSIFILPPSLATLEERLRRRQQDSEAVIQERLKAAQGEIAHYKEFDYLVVNDDFGRALSHLKSIVRVYRLRTLVQSELLAKLLADLAETD